MPEWENPQPFSVRRARADEWQALRDVRLHALALEPLAFGTTLEAERSVDNDSWKVRATEAAQSADTATWVAVDSGGLLIGMLGVGCVRGTPELFGMWVDPAFRRAGVGGRLLDAVLAWARSAYPRKEVRLEVHANQAPAMALYASRGFRVNGSRAPRLPGRGPGPVYEMTLSASTDAPPRDPHEHRE